MFRILVVEDNADMRELFCTVLSDSGYACFPAADGLEALEIMDREYIYRPDRSRYYDAGHGWICAYRGDPCGKDGASDPDGHRQGSIRRYAKGLPCRSR